MSERADRISSLLRERGYLERLARSLARGDGDEASDLAQDTWLAALRAEPGAIADPRRWLGTVARRVWASRLRRAAQGRPVELDERALAGTPVAEDPARAEITARLEAAVDALDEPYRTVLRLRYRDELQPREIAARLQRPSRTVATQLQRGLALLREELDRRSGGERERWLPGLLALASPRGAPRRAARRSLAAAASVAFMLVGLGVWRIAARGDAASAPTISVAAAPAPDASARQPRAPAPVERAPVAAESVERPAAPQRIAARTPAGEPVEAVVEIELVDATGAQLLVGEVLVRAGEDYGVRAVLDARGRARVELHASDFAPDADLPRVVDLAAHVPGHEQSLDHFLRIPEGVRELHRRIVLGGAETTLVADLVRADGSAASDVAVALSRRDYAAPAPEGFESARSALRTARTDATGRLEIAGLGIGDHELVAFFPDSGLALVALRIARAGVERHTLALPRPVFASGVARDQDGLPHAGVRVRVQSDVRWLHPRHLRTVTDVFGAYRLSVLPAAYVAFDAVDLAAPALRARAKQTVGTQDLRWDPLLVETAPVKIRLVDAQGEPLAGWIVRMFDASPTGLVTARTDARGRATLSAARAGAVQLLVFESLNDAGFPHLSAALDAPLAAERELVVERTPAHRATLRGRLEPRGWKPAGAWCVELVSDETGARYAFRCSAIEEGFVVPAIPVGKWQVVLRGPDALAHLVGPIDAEPDASLDLGPLAVEPAGVLRVRAEEGGSTPARRIDIAPVSSSGPCAPCAGALLGAEARTFELLPGRYLLVESRPEGPRRHALEIATGATTELVLAQ